MEIKEGVTYKYEKGGEKRKEGQGIPLFIVESFKNGFVKFYPHGGGFGYSVPEQKFREDFKEVSPSELKPMKGEVTIDGWENEDGSEIGFPSYLSHQKWNGFEQPMFTFEVAKELVTYSSGFGYDIRYVKGQNDEASKNWGEVEFYQFDDQNKKIFVWYDAGEDDEGKPIVGGGEVEPTMIEGVPHFRIGDGWVWQKTSRQRDLDEGVGKEEPASDQNEVSSLFEKPTSRNPYTKP